MFRPWYVRPAAFEDATPAQGTRKGEGQTLQSTVLNDIIRNVL